MSRNDSASAGQTPSEDGRGPLQEADSRPSSPALERTPWQKVRWYLLRAGAFLGALVLVLVLGTAGAAWYTSRSEFCRSCHIMEPYYVSWQESSHKDVPCIKCHFPPGVAEKVRGKLLGLVQLAKYVTASEGPRPAAEIPDASCLRSGCHETRLLSGKVDYHGVPFDHAPHLEELRRGKKLRCTSCHSQMVQGTHMTVTASTCFLCHFKEGRFNEGLGTCTRCHEIPKEAFDLGGGVTFHHDLAYERGVDCANCHEDLIRGNGEVPHERCGVCHNREDDIKRIGDHQFVHQMHVTDHKVDCLECHLGIEHSLDPQMIEHAASDCKSCHPDHHREQVDMLRGTGAKTAVAEPSSMLAVRIACPSCHRVKDSSSTGTVIWQASFEMCIHCHDASLAESLEAHYDRLEDSLSEIDSAVQRVRAALDSAELEEVQAAAIRAQLVNLRHDLDFLRVGNGIHNIHYAGTLARAVAEQVSSLCRQLEVEEPKVVLPEKAERLE